MRDQNSSKPPLWLIVAWLGLVAALFMGAIYEAAHSDADPGTQQYAATAGPAVCTTLYRFPTVDGVFGVLTAIEEQGFTVRQTADIVVTAVETYCPQNEYLLREFIDKYAPGTATV
jgi:hypothetical protein